MNATAAWNVLGLGIILATAACGGGDPGGDPGSGGSPAGGGGVAEGGQGGVGGDGAAGGTGGMGTGGMGTGGMGTGGMGTGGMGTGGEGGSLPMICTPNETMPCYEGPSGTEGVGLCSGGTSTCSPDGTAWSGCEGQVLPTTEVCGALGDEDCDGVSCSETVWSRALLGPASMSLSDVAVDGNGDVVVVAEYLGSLTVGTQTFTNPTSDPRLIVVKLDATGNVLWTKDVDGHAEDVHVTIGYMQRVILAGTFTGTLDFGVGPDGVVPGPSNGAEDIFVAQLTSAGIHEWSRHLAAHADNLTVDAVGTRAVRALELDYLGNIYLGGIYNGHWGGICFNGCPQGSAATAGWVRKIGSSGNDLWAKTFDAAGTQAVTSLDTKIGVGVVVGGFFTSSLTLGSQTYTNGFPSGGDAWLARFATNGDLVWSQALGGAGHQSIADVNTVAGDILVVGTFGGGNPFGLGPAVGSSDVFLASIDDNGSALWTQHYSGNADTQLGALQVVEAPMSHEVYVTGSLTGVATLAGQMQDGGTTYSGFVVKHDPQGNPAWSRVLSTVASGGSYVTSASINVDEHLVIGGVFTGDIDLGDQTHTHVGSADGFVAKLHP